jgi:hypothetical protein
LIGSWFWFSVTLSQLIQHKMRRSLDWENEIDERERLAIIYWVRCFGPSSYMSSPFEMTNVCPSQGS